MSVEAITWALRQPIDRTTTKFVLVVLANCAHPADGRAWPSVSYLSETTAQDRKTVLKNIQALEGSGLIEDTGDRAGKTKQVVVYRLCCGPLYATNSNTKKSPKRGTVSKTEQFQKRNSSEKGTVPFLQGTVPIYPENSPTNGTRKPKGNQKNLNATTTASVAALDWSANGLKAFQEDEQVVVVGLLNGHDPQAQQALLDEFAGLIEDKAVRNSPMALLAKLAAAAHAGTFVLNRGRRVRDERFIKLNPPTDKRRPGESSETPYEATVKQALQMFGPKGAAPNEAEFNRLTADAAHKWPEEARKSPVEASTYGKREAREQSKRNLPTKQGTSP